MIAAIRNPRMVVFAATALYAVGYLTWYSLTPLGLYPVLDGRELLALAKAISAGTLPKEAFYRAPLYPAVLSLFASGGLSDPQLIIAARIVNGTSHIVSTVLIMNIADQIWDRPQSVAVAGVLFGLNPVVLHFVGDPLDITLALTLMLIGLYFAVRAGGRLAWLASCGLFWSLATLTRPNLLLLVLAWPIIAILLPSLGSSRWQRACAAAIGPTVIFAAFGIVNYGIAHDFRLLPWQGAYNMWAANKPESNGRYYQQTTRVVATDPLTNPTRVESERLYRGENPNASDSDYGEMSRYWRDKTIGYIAAHPWQWMRLMRSKAFYFLNNFEQYNNKTYVFHKRRSPWLRLNPICWTLLLSLGITGAVIGFRDPRIRLIIVSGVVLALATLLFFVSARFRLPLVPLLAILAGGTGRYSIQELRQRRLWPAALVALIAGSFSLIPIDKIEAEKTIVVDLILISKAASQLHRHAESADYAARAVAANDSFTPAIELLCLTNFNQWFDRFLAGADTISIEAVSASCEKAAVISDQAQRFWGVLKLHRGQQQDARSLWQDLIDSGSTETESSLVALLLTGDLRVTDRIFLERIPWSARSLELLIALAMTGDADARKRLTQNYPLDHIKLQMRILGKLYRPL